MTENACCYNAAAQLITISPNLSVACIYVSVSVWPGGIAGSSLAYHLSRSSHSHTPLNVVLLEASCFGSQATGLSAGTFWSAGHAYPPLTTTSSSSHVPPLPLFDPTCEVNAHSAALYEEVQQRGFSCGLSRCGNLTLASTDSQRAHLVQEHARLVALGYNVLLLCSPEAVFQVEPALTGGNRYGVCTALPMCAHTSCVSSCSVWYWGHSSSASAHCWCAYLLLVFDACVSVWRHCGLWRADT